MAGAYPIIAVDLREHRLDRAREMGATHVHLADGMQNDIASNVMAATQGRGADHVFEAASIIPTLQLALDCRSEEHTSELQSLMRISYAVFCLKNKKTKHRQAKNIHMITHVLHTTRH